jgi:hypothetical protein
VPSVARWDDVQGVQLQLLDSRLGQCNVPQMRGVKRAPKDSDFENVTQTQFLGGKYFSTRSASGVPDAGTVW